EEINKVGKGIRGLAERKLGQQNVIEYGAELSKFDRMFRFEIKGNVMRIIDKGVQSVPHHCLEVLVIYFGESHRDHELQSGLHRFSVHALLGAGYVENLQEQRIVIITQ